MRWLLPVALVSVMFALNGCCHSEEPNAKGPLERIDKKPSGLLKVKEATIVALSDDGKMAITWDYGAFDGRSELQVWDVDKRTLIRSMQLPADPGNLAMVEFSPDGEKLLAVFGGRFQENFGRVFDGVRVFDLMSGKQLHRFPYNDDVGGEDAVWAPDGKYILAGEKLRLWSVETGLEVRDFKTGGRAVGFSGNGKVAYARDNQVIRSWSITTGARLGEFDFGHGSSTDKVQSGLNDRAMMILWGHNPGVAVWELSTGKRVIEARFNAQGERIAEDANATSPLELFGKISSFDFARSGKRALLAVEKVRRTYVDVGRNRKTSKYTRLDAKVVLWDVDRDKMVQTFPRGVKDAGYPVLLSGDGNTALIGTSAGYQVWKLSP